jgi:hypothetical protein
MIYVGELRILKKLYTLIYALNSYEEFTSSTD